jgi:hypothetical protein
LGLREGMGTMATIRLSENIEGRQCHPELRKFRQIL